MKFEVVDRRGRHKEVEAAAEPWKRLEAEVVGDRTIQSPAAVMNGDTEPARDVIPFKRTVRGEVQGWKGAVSFLMVSMPVGNGQVFMCRAVAIRTDEQVFTADYAIPPIWNREEDFTAAATQRLETFKSCSCARDGRCKFHGEALPGPKGVGKWLEADIKRLQHVQSTPLPEAVEVLMRAEQERSNNRIVVPGRG